jgi:hypothetical protein
VEFRYTNPHSYILIDVKEPDSDDSTVWTLEGPSPSLLSLDGITAKTINPGDQLVLTIDPLRTGAPGGSWSPVKMWWLKDGRPLVAPREARYPDRDGTQNKWPRNDAINRRAILRMAAPEVEADLFQIMAWFGEARRVLDLLKTASDIAIAKQVGLHRLAVRRDRQDPVKAEAALASSEALKAGPRRSKAADRNFYNKVCLPEAIQARANLVQKIKEGVARARAAGKRIGRPTVSPDKEAAVRNLLRKGVSTRATVVKASVSVGTVIRIKKALGLEVGARPGRSGESATWRPKRWPIRRAIPPLQQVVAWEPEVVSCEAQCRFRTLCRNNPRSFRDKRA